MKRSRPSTPAEVTSLGSRFTPIPSARLCVVSGVSPEVRPLVELEGSRTAASVAVHP